jgi:hypothetical protein
MKRSPSLAGLLVLLPLLFSALPGCGGEKFGKVSDKVTYKDKPLKGGKVVFANEDNSKVENVKIDLEGNYASSRVPYGKLNVGVTPAPKGFAAIVPRDAKDAKKPPIPADNPLAKEYGKGGGEGVYVDIPGELRDPAKSKITVTIDAPERTFPIDLLKKQSK